MFRNLLNRYTNKDPLLEGIDTNVDTGIAVPVTTSNATITDDSVVNANPNNLFSLLNKFINKDNLKMLVSFFAIFVLLYFVMGIYFRVFGLESQNNIVSLTNLILSSVVTISAFSKYYQLDDDKKNNLSETLYTIFKTNIEDIETTFKLVVLVGFTFGLKKILHLPTPEGNNSFVLEISNFILWVSLLLNIIVVFCTDLLNIPVIKVVEDTINTILYGETVKVVEDTQSDDTTVSDKPGDDKPNDIVPQPAEEVFNVSNNIYTYDDAPNVCSALGARLASYEEVEDAYNKGADWCTYGWSQNQMGFFPTQKETWQKLQSNNAMKNSCGRPGVNGGYMPNNKMKLGVNCYGIKPKASDLDIERMKTNNIVPRTKKDVITERKVAFWKENADKMLNLNPHSKGDWSLY
jgi:hypothetical protein